MNYIITFYIFRPFDVLDIALYSKYYIAKFIFQCAGLYPTNNAETNKFILEDCKANILVVEDMKMARAIEPYRNQLPHLKCIIVYDDQVTSNSNDIISWRQVMEMGKEDRDESEMLARQRRMAINQCCILVYTSGTTGNPKGKT